METYKSLSCSSKMDISDLSQECYSYMKIKQFLADRLSQQQEEIDTLRRKVKYYIARDVVNKDIIAKLTNQLVYLKRKEGNYSFCSEEAISQDLENESKDKSKKEEIKDDEQSREELHEEINKLTADKYILFNELNELVMGLKRCKLDKLNELLIRSKNHLKDEMPVVNGLQLNVLSAESQLCQIIRMDCKRNINTITQENINYYDTLVKECEKDFTCLLEKKLKIQKDL